MIWFWENNKLPARRSACVARSCPRWRPRSEPRLIWRDPSVCLCSLLRTQVLGKQRTSKGQTRNFSLCTESRLKNKRWDLVMYLSRGRSFE